MGSAAPAGSLVTTLKETEVPARTTGTLGATVAVGGRLVTATVRLAPPAPAVAAKRATATPGVVIGGSPCSTEAVPTTEMDSSPFTAMNFPAVSHTGDPAEVSTG